MAVAGGVQIVWNEPQPQPYYYMIYRKPGGAGFPKRVAPVFSDIVGRWVDSQAKPGKSFVYRVCAVYSPDGSTSTCTNWFK